MVQPDFDLQTAYYGGHDIARFVAHSLFWLHGRGDDYRIVGGQAWPASIERQIGPSWGFPGHGKQAGHEGVALILCVSPRSEEDQEKRDPGGPKAVMSLDQPHELRSVFSCV